MKWSGTVLAVLILAAFVYSAGRAITWTFPDLDQASLMLGSVSYSWIRDDAPLAEWKYPPVPGWSHASYGGGPRLSWWIIADGNTYWWGISVPLWMPLALVAVPTAVLWYLDRRGIARACRRLLNRLTPKQPKRVTAWQIAFCCVTHVVATILVLIAFGRLYWFFVQHPMSDSLKLAETLVARTLVWGAPLWGLLWAWLWTKWRNRLLSRQPGERCGACGYDLTGNVSGRCPECGTTISGSSVQGR